MRRLRFGRPLGEVSLMTLRLATTSTVTYLDVARELQLSRRDASVAVYGLKQRGLVEVVARQQVDGARKPVLVVRAADAESPSAVPGVLCLDWPGRP